MKSWQKTIKYAAIALAVFLIISIISGIVGTAGVVSHIFDKDPVLGDVKTYDVSQEITGLKVEINAADFTIEIGESFCVESNLEKLNVTVNDGTLVVKEPSKRNFGKGYNGAVLTITVPSNFVFAKAEIQTGAGKVTVNSLSSERLILELGAGEVNIGQLNASVSAEISGGAGAITIRNGLLNNVDFEMGVGELNMTSAVLGDNEFAFGVGEANLALIGTESEYQLHFDKGLGSVCVAGQNMQDDRIFGTGNNVIDIEGGIGSINIDFTQNIDS